MRRQAKTFVFSLAAAYARCLLAPSKIRGADTSPLRQWQSSASESDIPQTTAGFEPLPRCEAQSQTDRLAVQAGFRRCLQNKENKDRPMRRGSCERTNSGEEA